MNDLIYRQAAINEIEYELEMINSALDSLTLDFNARERLYQRRGEAKEILDSIQQLPPAQSEPRWIPVKKKPKAIGSYLCFEEGGFCYVDTWNGANWELIVKAYARPIAYMPLPKPYERSEE